MTFRRRFEPIGCLILFCLAAETAKAQEAEPFRIRNLSPPVAIFGLPSWARVPEHAVLGVVSELANHYRLSQRGSDRLILDGETFRMNFSYERPLGERWSVSAELPFYRISGGVLDNLVDGWHSTFGMPDGGRNNRGENELLFEIGDAGGDFFRLDSSGAGIGDLQLSIARRIGAGDGFVLRAGVKLPTGDEDLLAGSGATDYAVTLMRPRELMLPRRRAGYYWGAGLMKLGRPERIRFRTEDLALVGVVGAGIALKPRFGIKGQIDVSTALYDTPLKELGQAAAQATLGGWWEMRGSGMLNFGVVEDLNVSTAPDVVLHVGLSWLW